GARRAEKLLPLQEQIAAEGGEARAIGLDVTDSASVSQCFDELANRFPKAPATHPLLSRSANLMRSLLLQRELLTVLPVSHVIDLL
ncbi:hypothetical protein C1X54_38185, partial [Pseudomonas sp. GW460-13]